MVNTSRTHSREPNSEKNRATFVVKIEYCQNRTWQGRVVWADENRVEFFRSALELIRIMDEVISQGAMLQIPDQSEESSVS
ncbi:hypothetical protein [Butyrivibrio proteoclasticus]|uniref:hypothetical protein n=1 Tax=Butyrivibrio proteoclasticus TaxID=43305 RepID=UPI0006881556|nr:hypothetical protein [Butyrivibrio proteoclasticus]